MVIHTNVFVRNINVIIAIDDNFSTSVSTCQWDEPIVGTVVLLICNLSSHTSYRESVPKVS